MDDELTAELARAYYALIRERDYGDWKPLAQRLREARTLLYEERELAADILEGKRPRPDHRPAQTRGFT